MKPNSYYSRLRGVLPLWAAALLVAGPSLAADYFLVAKPVTKTMPGSVPVVMWGFAVDADNDLTTDGGEVATVPGPRLTVLPTDVTGLTINVRNDLPEPISLVIPGQLGTGDPVLLSQRVRSFTHETAPGETGLYTWPTLKPGTYLYLSGTHPAVQVQMGLYGAVTRDYATGAAYNGVSYTKEAVVLYSEIDPDLHAAVATGTYGTPPAMTSTINYSPKYFLVNGEPFPQGSTTVNGLVPNDAVLVRFLNAGLKTHVPTLLGASMELVAEDGNAYSRRRATPSALLPAGKTIDAIFTPGLVGTYPLFDRALDLTNAGAPGGGLLTYLVVGSGAGAPVALDDVYSVAEETPLAVTAPGVLTNDSGSPTGAVLLSSTANGLLLFNPDGSFAYTPAVNFVGTDLFTYQAHNASSDSNVATVRITVTQVNDTPVAANDSYSVMAGNPLSVMMTPGVLGNDTDADGNPLSAVLATPPAHASSFTLHADGTFMYTAACAFVGTDSFTYRASDGVLSSSPATVAITVSAFVNKPPVVNPDWATVRFSTSAVSTQVSIPVLANDADPDAACSGGLNLASIVITAAPSMGGTATPQANGTILYKPKFLFRGTDTFKYKVRDASGALSQAATVRVNVTR